jgi:hypothetical protein
VSTKQETAQVHGIHFNHKLLSFFNFSYDFSVISDSKGDKDLLLIIVIILVVSLLIGILIVVNFIMWQRSRRKQVTRKEKVKLR